MKSLLIKIGLMFLVFQNCLVYGQDIDKKLFTADSIPSMKVFLDSAMVNSPAIKMYETQIVQNQCQIDLLKYNWMKEIYMVVDSKYGKYGATQPGDQMNLGYGSGVVVKVPLSALTGNSERKKIAKMELNESVYNKQVLISELKKAIIKQYNETIYRKQVLAIKIESYEVAYINKRLSEKEFKSGLIHVDQYSRVSEIYYTQLQQLEEAKMLLKTNLAVLIEMAGIRTNSI
jgi:outer membrane protein TolC